MDKVFTISPLNNLSPHPKGNSLIISQDSHASQSLTMDLIMGEQ